MTRIVTLALALSLVAAGGCADLGPGGDDLAGEIAENRRKWEAAAPQSYVFDLERLCFCGEEARGPVRIRVTSGVPTAWAYVQGGGEVAADLRPFFPGVEGLFDVLEEAVRENAHQIQVTWDPQTGAPLDLWIDYRVEVADEEQGYRIVAIPRPVT